MDPQELVRGARVKGLAGLEAVEVRAVEPVGSNLNVMFRTRNGLDEVTLTPEAVQRLEVVGDGAPSFTADGEAFRLALEGLRMSRASSIDPFLAVHSSQIQPLPHQISAVYDKMLPRLPLRYVLADDPGAGKTVMCGLLVKEMMARGDLRRCLIVCPGSLCTQWQDELRDKFDLSFTILTRDLLEASVSRNAFKDHDLIIARLDQLSRNDDIQRLLDQVSWDLIVFDEAHKLSANVQGKEVKKTGRYQLAERLAKTTENLLLMTATPHNGKPKDFEAFMALVDPDRFEGAARSRTRKPQVDDLMRRLVKEDLVTFEGKPLFPERRSYTVNYTLSPAEKALYDAVTAYVGEGFNRAEKIGGKRGSSVGFALTVLQRRLASSPEAIYQSLRRRHERLSQTLNDLQHGRRPATRHGAAFVDDFDEDDLSLEQWEQGDDLLGDDITAAQTAEELALEVQELGTLVKLAKQVRDSGQDAKWQALREVLQDPEMYGPAGRREKLIVFTEHKDTLGYLQAQVSNFLGDPDAVVTISGSLGRDARKAAQERFLNDPEALILIATDAAGEGVNLQRAHLMVSYDLPWNPNRLEQRFGRVHRIGQTEVCHLWNLVSVETREGQVYSRLLEKLEQERQALGGRVWDVLGQVTFEDQTLADLLKEAVRYGDREDVRARLNQVVDSSLDRGALEELLQARALTDEVMSEADLAAVKDEMDRAIARKLEPYFVGRFFLDAMEMLGGKVREREPGRYEVTRVPAALKAASQTLGLPPGLIQERYERVTFDPDLATLPGKPPAKLVAPGTPLMDATIQAVETRWGDALAQGAVLVDEEDYGEKPHLLFCAEDAVTDGRVGPDGKRRRVAEYLSFVNLTPDGQATFAGYAPHLDLRPVTVEERQVLEQGGFLSLASPKANAEAYTAAVLAPQHLQELQARRVPMIQKTRHLVTQRLNAETEYWENRAWEDEEKGRATGSDMTLTVRNHRDRAAELRGRKEERLAALAAEEQLSSGAPRVCAEALVVPVGLLAKLMPGHWPDLDRRRQVEAVAMACVMRQEELLGNTVKDVSREHLGWDVESRTPAGNVRRIEVKGVSAGAGRVTVTANELLQSKNTPESFRLAIVRVEGEGANLHPARLTVLAEPFAEESLSDAAADVSYNVDKLLTKGVAERDVWF